MDVAVTPASAYLRVLLIALQFPVCSSTGIEVVERISAVLSRISNQEKKMFVDALRLYSPNLFYTRLIMPLQNALSLVISTTRVTDIDNRARRAENICVAMGMLFLANSTVNPRHVTIDKFYNDEANRQPPATLYSEYVSYRQAVLNGDGKAAATPSSFLTRFTFLLSAETKRKLLLAASASEQQSAQIQMLQHSIFLGAVTPFFVMQVDRNNLLQHALHIVQQVSDAQLKMPLKVVFLGEEGIDAGGVKKEFFQLLIEQLLDMKYGMFTLCGAGGRYLWFNKDCTWAREEFRLVGLLLGLAVYNDVTLNVNFSRVIYKKMLRQSVGFDDILDLDPDLHHGFMQMLEYSPASEVENVFCRTHVVSWTDMLGQERKVNLLPGGDDIPVTGENRGVFVNLFASWMVNDSVSTQFNEFFGGFSRVVSPQSTLLFHSEELELLVAGSPNLDFRELQENTEYIGWSSSSNPGEACVHDFWETLHEMTIDQKKKFLMFVSGATKAPMGGLRNLGFKLQRMGPDSSNLPTAHTCFNTLLIPDYSSKEKLKFCLLRAIEECEGFGLK